MQLTVETDLLQMLLVLVRVTALLAVAPVFGPIHYAPQVRVLLGVLLAFLVWPLVPAATPLVGGIPDLVLKVSGELLLGVSVGFMVHLMFSVVTISGQLMAITGGLAMAQVFDPMNSEEVTVLTRFKNIILFIMFFQLDLHHQLLRGLLWSFDAIPPGGVGYGQRLGVALNAQFAGILTAGLQIALPAMVMVLLVQAGMALLARMAPNMNVFFSIGHLVTAFMTFGVLLLSLPLLKSVFMGLFEKMGPDLVTIVRALAS